MQRSVIPIGIGFFLLAAVGFWMVLYATVWGPGWVADSHQYIGAARGLVHRGVLAYPGSGGSLVPLTHYPPAFSVVLAAFERLGLNSYGAIRYFHAFLFALTIILIGITVFRISRSPWWGLFASLMTLFSAALLERHAWALSEPLFLFTTLGGFLFVDLFYQTNRRLFLIFALMCLTTAWMTRYVGVVAIVTLVCIFATLRTQGWKQTLLNILLTVVISSLPMIFWAARNFYIESQFLDRDLKYTPLGPKNWLSMIQTLAGWLLPDRIVVGRERWLVIGGIVALILVVSWWFYEARKRAITPIQMLRLRPLVPIYILYSILYVPFVILSKLLFDPMIGFTERMLIPTQLSVLVIVPIFLNYLWRNWKRLGKLVALIIALVLLVYYSNESLNRLERLHKQGLGVANRRWHESQVIQTLRRINEGDLYNNSISTMYLWRGETGRYFTELGNGRNQILGEPVYLIVFHYLSPNARLQKLMDGLPILLEDAIATIYLYPSNGPGQ